MSDMAGHDSTCVDKHPCAACVEKERKNTAITAAFGEDMRRVKTKSAGIIQDLTSQLARVQAEAA